MQYDSIPAITGEQLIKLLLRDGWKDCGQKTHGIGLTKKVGEKNLVTIVPNKNTPLPDGTLSSILGVKQTYLGKKGLAELIEKYGKKQGKNTL